MATVVQFLVSMVVYHTFKPIVFFALQAQVAIEKPLYCYFQIYNVQALVAFSNPSPVWLLNCTVNCKPLWLVLGGTEQIIEDNRATFSCSSKCRLKSDKTQTHYTKHTLHTTAHY